MLVVVVVGFFVGFCQLGIKLSGFIAIAGALRKRHFKIWFDKNFTIRQQFDITVKSEADN